VKCKYCGNVVSKANENNHYPWCNKSHRNLFIRSRMIVGGKKAYALAQDKFLQNFGSTFSNEGDCQNSNPIRT
jgi:hypothetical protein